MIDQKTSTTTRESSRVYDSINNISNKLLKDKEGLQGKEKEYIGKSLSRSIELSFGISHKQKGTIKELYFLSKYEEIVDEMNNQIAFTIQYLAELMDRHRNDKTVKKIISILLRRKLLFVYGYEGKAAESYGIKIYYTTEATEYDIEGALYEYKEGDEMRYKQEQQLIQYKQDLKRKPSKSAEEVAKHNEEVRKETEKLKQDRPLTRQEQAKVFVSKTKVATHQEEYTKLTKKYERHTRTCRLKDEAELRGKANTCEQCQRMSLRLLELSRVLVGEIAKQPDKLNTMVLPDNEVLKLE